MVLSLNQSRERLLRSPPRKMPPTAHFPIGHDTHIVVARVVRVPRQAGSSIVYAVPLFVGPAGVDGIDPTAKATASTLALESLTQHFVPPLSEQRTKLCREELKRPNQQKYKQGNFEDDPLHFCEEVAIFTVHPELETHLPLLPIFAATPGLNVPPNSLAELESIYTRTFPGEESFRNARASWFDPVASDNFLNEIARRSSEYRDQHMIELLTRTVGQDRRVVAVVRGTHVVMQERAIRSLLR